MGWFIFISFLILCDYGEKHPNVVTGAIVIFVLASLIYEEYKAPKILRHKEEDSRRRQQQEEENKRFKQQQYDENQRDILRRILRCTTNTTSILLSLSSNIHDAEHALDEAEEEFSYGAFAPFWDAIERAVTHLEHFEINTKKIIDHTANYKILISDLNSIPPEFPLEIKNLPVITNTADRMNRIVHRAQRKYNFAKIYEKRKTNQLLLMGFSSLAMGLYEMRSRIEASNKALSYAISTLAVRSQENTNKIISNFQSAREELKSEIEARCDN